MSHPSKAKGYRFEKTVVDQALEAGIPAERAWGSNGQSLGQHPEVDVLMAGLKAQLKCRKKLPDVVRPTSNVDMQIIKENYGETFVVVPYKLFLQLIRIYHDNLPKGIVSGG